MSDLQNEIHEDQEIKENRIDRKKRIELNKSEDNLVRENNVENALDGKVFDIYDVIHRSSDPVVIKLRNLKKFGIDDEMIVSSYKESAGTMETQSTAINTLDAVFKKLALYITYQPNGYVIDLRTGDLDRKASIRQAIRIGITDYNLPEDTLVEKIQKRLELMDKGQKIMDKITNMDVSQAIKENRIITSMTQKIDTIYDNKEFFDLLGKNEESFKYLSDEAKEALRKARQELREQDPVKMQYIKLEIELNESKNSPLYNANLRNREKFLKINPKYRDWANSIRDKNGNINPNVLGEYKEYEQNVKINCLLTNFERLRSKGINNLTSDERKGLVITAVAAFGLKDSKDRLIINKECWKVLRELSPELAPKKGFKEKFNAFLENELDLDEKLTPENFKNVVSICNEGVDKSFDLVEFINITERSANKKDYIHDEDFNGYFKLKSIDLNFQEKLDNYGKSSAEKYFYDSNIKFTQEDLEAFNESYRDCTIKSWIDNKEDALILKYATLSRISEKLKNPTTEYEKEQKAKIDEKVTKFKEEHPDIVEKCEEDGELTESANQKAEEYRNIMCEASILKFYSIDIKNQNEGKGYDSLDPAHKKAYIRNTLVGIKYAKENNNDSILKMAQRRLENMNTGDKNFITVDETGNVIVNEESILNEYNSMSDGKWNSFEELEKTSEDRKDSFILKKLEEYEQLPETKFIKLDSSKDKLEQIESIRAKSNPIENTTVRDEIRTGESKESANNKYNDSNELNDSKQGFWNNLRNKFKKLFTPRLTDGNNQDIADVNEGFFKKIINKIKGNKPDNTLKETKEVEEHQIKSSPFDRYIIKGEIGLQDPNSRKNNEFSQKSNKKDLDERV